MSRTRCSAPIDSGKPVAQHLHAIKNALKEIESLNLTGDAQNQFQSIQKYVSKFECVSFFTLWLKLLTIIQKANLVIEVRDTTLDVVRETLIVW